MNQTAPVLTQQKWDYFKLKCLEVFLGGLNLRDSKYLIIELLISILASLITFLIPYFINLYAVALIVPAIMNLLLISLQQKLTQDQMKLYYLFFSVTQCALTCSSIYFSKNIIEIFIYWFLFPRNHAIELGFTQSENCSRQNYSIFYLAIILILDQTGYSTQADILRIVYYFTPLAFFIGLYGQFSQFFEYIIEQVNFVMGCSFTYSLVRTITICIINGANIGILIGISYSNKKATKILTGIFGLFRIYNVLGNVQKDDKQLYKSVNWNRKQIIIDVLITTFYVVMIIIGNFATLGHTEIIFYVTLGFSLLLVISLSFFDKLAITIVHTIVIGLHQLLISSLDYQEQNILIILITYRLFNLSHTNSLYLIVEELFTFIIYKVRDESLENVFYISFAFSIILRGICRILPRIKIWFIANTQMWNVKKQRVNNALLVIIIQIILFPISLSVLIISSILDVPYMPFLGVPLFYLSSLRPYRNSTEISKHIQGSSEASIYNAFINQACSQILYPINYGNNYLLRIGKYLAFIQILEYSESYAVIQFKGLESQETTNCHSVEATEVDRQIEANEFKSSITFREKLKVESYEENQIVLTGIIESSDFVQGFKETYLKCLTYYCQDLQQQHFESIQILGKQYEGNLQYFPQSLANLIQLPVKYNQQIKIKESEIKIPVKLEVKPKKTQIYQDDDLMGMLEEFDNMMPTQTKKVENFQQHQVQESKLFDSLTRAILYIYQISLGDLDFNFKQRLNQKLIHDLFSNSQNLQNKRQFNTLDPIFSQIVTKSIRAALKISLDIFSIEGIINLNDKEFLEQIDELRDTYVGMGHEDQWQSALQNKLPLWSLGYDAGKNQLVVYRSTFQQIECQLFRFDREVIRGIEANLQMELLFITNDEEERYSIQTHEQFFRNMIIEGSELPLGYAPFYSGPIQISLR